ncbi:transcription-repair coupling factor [Gilvibacter sp. SZ-19]|uniref:transcription-repair coupling factor n=1 Tax=Gilvibacter sp. SZ-19 TaxID=754429 RepID=UPI000B3C69F6|nr:transcription-repair coupling factor [Gilvibacter sp. SZ-19]ARV11687.1 transcription-repair coupling factor [Gilvibacter sp. SZ-19]
MSKTLVQSVFNESSSLRKLGEAISKNQARTTLSGLHGSAFSIVVAQLFKETDLPFLCVFNDKEEAAYHLNDLEQLVGEQDVLFFPGSYRRPYQIEETNNANVLLRSEVLNRINSRKKPALIVTYPEALFEKVVTRKELERNTLSVKVGDELSLDFVNEVLFSYQFKRVDFVTEPGEFSVRGGILDVFSFSHDEPYRLEFFGNEVDSIRCFDVETQLSTEQVKRIGIIPNVANKLLEEQRASFLEYIARKTVVFTANQRLIEEKLDDFYQKAEETFAELDQTVKQLKPEELFINGNTFSALLESFTHVAEVPSDGEIAFRTQPQPPFKKQFPVLTKDLQQKHAKGYTNYIFCDTVEQAKRFEDILEDLDADVKYQTAVFSLYAGFVDAESKTACYTDHQIFERYHRFHLKNGYAKKQAITLKELTNLEVGDYVTHIDHGIGKFGGLQKIEVEGKFQEAIKLIYGDRDILYLSIHSLHKIAKYNGKDGTAPKIYKLGSNAWKKLKQKTKKKVKEIAFNLIELYAKRRLQKGFQYAPDSYLQHELESSFIYEDTPDQTKATEDIKRDMESERPMDRLVCGDVGFGKTEVAIRAAFKAVDNGKQVAVLVPTTILAFQHHKSFSKRMKRLPVNIDYLNRFRTTKERNKVLEDLASGKLDIVIGTHQLVNKGIKFKDLGLLIIDEEQKFGVAVKDKLKTIKENVDTLTLTATPIPRTLQFSLMAARDLSVINTPPANRYPIETRVIRFSEEAIRDALRYEISRGGQAFFVHNRIENIQEVAGMLQRLLPDAKIGVGHGQMDGKKLEKLMLSFMDGAFDILVSTTIIENGLDVPNANTIFINNANNFGLSDLHQMRGRVGRSNKKAFCYFITPPYSAMTTDARKRIQALEQYTELGGGFKIAMKDLEIRGAGDILGGEQSGFINEIGFETYQKILAEAIEELKEKEFKSLYQGQEEKDKKWIKETVIDTDFELLFPSEYVNNISERLNLYHKLGELKDETELQAFQKELEDRFGPLPEEAQDLLDSVRIKWMALDLGLERVLMKKNKMVGYFISDQQSGYYQSNTFGKVLNYVQQHPDKVNMTEKQTRSGLKLLLRFGTIKSVPQALAALNPLHQATQK